MFLFFLYSFYILLRNCGKNIRQILLKFNDPGLDLGLGMKGRTILNLILCLHSEIAYFSASLRVSIKARKRFFPYPFSQYFLTNFRRVWPRYGLHKIIVIFHPVILSIALKTGSPNVTYNRCETALEKILISLHHKHPVASIQAVLI